MNADKILPILCRYLKDTDNRLLATAERSFAVHISAPGGWGGRADSWCWRAPCYLHDYMDSAVQLRPLVVTPEREMDSFSFFV